MSNPAVIEITPEWEWVKVATSITVGNIHMINRCARYFRTYRLTNDTGPANPTAPSGNQEGIIPDEAIQIFLNCTEEQIIANELIDVYLFCANNDLDSNDIGKVVIDT